MNMIGFGLLYRYGYFKQKINLDGSQVTDNEKLHFAQLPIVPVMDENNNRQIMQIPLRGMMVFAQVWKVSVGRINLYLFDTDIPQNNDEFKAITYNLYGGGEEQRFKQELLLAIYSTQFIRINNIKPSLFHYNDESTSEF